VKLSEILSKKKSATATVATVATLPLIYPPTVATVASVAVANTNNVRLNAANDSQPKDEPVVVAIASKPKTRPDRQEWKPAPCNRCAHLSRFVGGNACRTANGLPHLFGLLYTVPDDQGVACESWQADR